MASGRPALDPLTGARRMRNTRGQDATTERGAADGEPAGWLRRISIGIIHQVTQVSYDCTTGISNFKIGTIHAN